MQKTSNQWPLVCQFVEEITLVGRWQSEQWLWQDIFLSLTDAQRDLSLEYLHLVESSSPRTAQSLAVLELFKDERTDYRFNLSSGQPKLFFALSFNDTNSLPKPVQITASQAVAACYMDTDYLVLSMDMPLAIQAWMEAYMTKHGELIEVKKKKYKGAGRAKS